jgi:phospholipase C
MAGAHAIKKENWILLGNGRRIIRFRGVLGGSFGIRVQATRGPNREDPVEPVDPRPSAPTTAGEVVVRDADPAPSGRPTTATGSTSTGTIHRDHRAALTGASETRDHRTARPGSTATTRRRATVEARDHRVPGGESREGTVVEARRPVLDRPTIGDAGTVRDPGPIDPPPLPSPPIDVRVAMQGGAVLFERSGVSEEGTRHIDVGGASIPEDGIVEVTFANPNNFELQLHFFVDIENPIETTTTTVPADLLDRVFNDTLHFLAPSVILRDGKGIIAFPYEAGDFIDKIELDLGLPINLHIQLEAPKLELIDHAEAVRLVATTLAEEIARARKPANPANPLHEPEQPLPVPADFASRVVDAFFDPAQTLPDLFTGMPLHEWQWKGPLARRTFLAKSRLGQRDDIALSIDLTLTQVAVTAGRLDIQLEHPSGRLIVALPNARGAEPHSSPSLPDDTLSRGLLSSRFELEINLSGLEVELDLGRNRGILTPLQWLAEKVGGEIIEAVGELLKGGKLRQFEDKGMRQLKDRSAQFGELATRIMNEIANRDHVFLSARKRPAGWSIETYDPAQLAVGDEEGAAPAEDRFESIDMEVEAVEPIDGPMPSWASERLTSRIDHLVFLMMENRSFDHMLGYLSHPNHGRRSDIDGHDGREIELGGDFAGTRITPQPHARARFPPSPGHHVQTIARQIAGGAMNGFVSEFAHKLEGHREINPEGNYNYPDRIHRFYTGETLETYDQLARDEMILDRWFSALPAGTYPNRFCYYAGKTPAIDNHELFQQAGYHRDVTVFDLMDREGVEWVCYESDVTFLRMFERYRLDTTRIRPIGELLREDRREALPPVTFIDPNFKGAPSKDGPNDDHAPADVGNGQDLIGDIINSLSKRDGWGKTMFVITYDEHGGFADHVPPPGVPGSDFPPVEGEPPPIPLVHAELTSYGVRVPALVVSPAVEPGTVGHKIYDHTTPFRTIVERFMPSLRNSAILPERVRRARHLGELVSDRMRVLDPGPVVRVLRSTQRPPDAVVRSENDPVRPFLAPTPTVDDFHYVLRRLGSPLPPLRVSSAPWALAHWPSRVER